MLTLGPFRLLTAALVSAGLAATSVSAAAHGEGATGPPAPSAASGTSATSADFVPSGPGAAPRSLSGTQPDIVVLVTDDQTWEAIEYMPYLQSQIDEGQFVTFAENEVNNALCCPSRATILTGLVDTRTGVLHNGLADAFDPDLTIGRSLHDAGYRTGMFGKLLNGYVAADGTWPGWDDFQPVLPKGLYNQYDYEMYENGTLHSYGSAPGDYQVDVLTGKATTFIATAPTDQPMFLYVAPTSTHTPWVQAPRHTEALADAEITLPPAFAEADVTDKPTWVGQLDRPGANSGISNRRRAYTAGLSVDDMLRQIDAQLAATGRLEDTVVIVASDNGLASGTHRWASKMCEFDSCAAAPLLVRYPGQPGRTDPRLTSNIDLAPTLADLGAATLQERPDGISLVAAIEQPRPGRAPTHTALLSHWPGGDQQGNYSGDTGLPPTPGFYGIRTPRWRYIELTNLAAPGHREYELYDQLRDPDELVNVAGDQRYARIRSALQGELYNLIRATGADPLADQGSWRPGPW